MKISAKFFAATALLFVLVCVAASAQRTPMRPSPELPRTQNAPLTNADVLALQAAGLNEAIITQKIRGAPSTAFDVSVDGLKTLKAAGVTDEVIHAMLESASSSAGYSNTDDPGLMHQPGIYVQIAGHDGLTHLLVMEHTQAIGAKSSTNAAASVGSSIGMVAGLPIPRGKTHIRAALNDPRSPVQIDDQNPSFYFYTTEETQRFGGSDFSVRDFTLVKLKQTAKTREIEISTVSNGIRSYGEPASTGIDEKVRQPTTIQKVKPGIYLIKLQQPLKPGEYAFEHLLDGVFYDFGVTGAR